MTQYNVPSRERAVPTSRLSGERGVSLRSVGHRLRWTGLRAREAQPGTQAGPGRPLRQLPGEVFATWPLPDIVARPGRLLLNRGRLRAARRCASETQNHLSIENITD